MANLRQSAVNAVTWTLVRTGGRHLSGFVIFVVLARLLPPEAFGLVAWAGVFVGFCQIFVNAGLAQALVQREDIEPGHRDTAFWANLAIATLLLSAVLLGADGFSNLVGEPGLAPVLRALSLLLPVSALSGVQMALLRRELRFKPLALRVLVGNVLGGALGIVMAFEGFGLWSLVAQQLAAAVIAVVMLWGVSDWRPGLRLSRRHLAELFSFGSNFAGGGLLRFVSMHADQFLIGSLLGAEALGIYVIGLRAMRFVIDMVSMTLNQVALPVLSRLQSDLPRMRRAILTTAQVNAFVSMPAFLGLAVIATDFVPAVFGAKWEPSIPVMQILAVYAVFHSVRVVSGPVINAMGKPRWTLAIEGVEAPLVVLIWIAAQWGVAGVAAAVTLRAALILPFSLLGIRGVVSLGVFAGLAPYVVPVLASVAMVGVVLGLNALAAEVDIWLRLGAKGIAGALAYLVLVRLLAPAHFAEVQDLLWRAVPASLRPRPRPAS